MVVITKRGGSKHLKLSAEEPVKENWNKNSNFIEKLSVQSIPLLKDDPIFFNNAKVFIKT